jgi:hypothetical protein
MTKSPKRPRDVSQLAKTMVDIAIGETTDKPKSASAVEFGRQGGLARSQLLTTKERSEIAKIAAKKRWEKP